ncbi:putative heme ABC transporter permease protein [Selenomonas ruminantium subsp. lactilytica TAM6421]|uniref:Putative heme ABC transporter permease protein n=1 Tax=Selenomonas ruminantium subsp. lactilytica (strain NBRC 103574 / TAM6421) TaxID=927704 RepID=I0GST8_SELRL|nr:heme exporter protein CcmB [Selenomonas ruminantium]BAL83825.1 putative heme ABC transporter permease protein [Selenomonas ruminantium subsp. lactilytica TAM6421]
MKSSLWEATKLVFRKELIMGLRFKASWMAMFMFALTTLACVSLALQGGQLEPKLAAALLWIIIFFASMAGADRSFADEDMAGTLLTLKLYGGAQPVLWGKMLYSFFLLALLSLFIAPLFLVLSGVEAILAGVFVLTLLLGVAGLAAAGTLLAALTTGARVKNGLFAVLMLPVILPVFLPAIFLTAGAFEGSEPSLSYLGGMALYDALLAVGASVLFDYLWYED